MQRLPLTLNLAFDWQKFTRYWETHKDTRAFSPLTTTTSGTLSARRRAGRTTSTGAPPPIATIGLSDGASARWKVNQPETTTNTVWIGRFNLDLHPQPRVVITSGSRTRSCRRATSSTCTPSSPGPRRCPPARLRVGTCWASPAWRSTGTSEVRRTQSSVKTSSHLQTCW